MTEKDLVSILDEYMGRDGGYIKPKVDESGEVSFLIANDNAQASNANENFELVKESELFTGKPKVECAGCADIPNIIDGDPEDE